MKDKFLAGEVTTKEFGIIWVENAKHNAVEDPGRPGREVPYEDRLNAVDDPGRPGSELSDLIPWRSNGYVLWEQKPVEER